MRQCVNDKEILDVRLDTVGYGSACDLIQTLTQAKQSSYIIAANVHVVMTAYWQKKYCQIVNSAALVTPDGMPLVWGMRLLGAKHQRRVYGPDLMLAWCDRAQEQNLPIYLYGSTPRTLEKLTRNLQATFPNLKIAGTHSPPFRTLSLEEEAADRERIQQSGAAVIFVGLGCPKQEEWMYRQLGRLNAVMIGVGAAFSFHSGEVVQAPRWMMRFGLEWLFRLCQEPKRLWTRYLFTNFAFVCLFSKQLLKHYLSSFLERPTASSTLSK